MFSGCGTFIQRITYVVKPAPNNNNKGYEFVILHYEKILKNPKEEYLFKPASGVYYIAKFAKEKGYNYVRFIYPPEFKSFMFNSAKEIKECYKITFNPFDKCGSIKGYKVNINPFIYEIGAVLYKKQPVDVLTVSVDDILNEFKEYSLDNHHYEIIENPNLAEVK